MAKDATFKFTGKDNVSEALKTINQNIQKVTKATKNAAKSINTFNAALTVVKATVNGIGKIISFALNTIIKAVQAALKTLKNIITGLFNFIKTALSTLLSWTVKALGKVFDGIKKLFTNIFSFSKDVIKKTAQVIKKGIEFIIDSVKGYAEDEYNEIQLKVSLGDSYDQVMKSFNKLLRYTTSSDDELLTAFATFAEVGKKPEEIEKYAKASIYLANATGRSLSQITRLLLGQEAAGADLERTLYRLGINISEQEQSISDIDKIIRQLEPEMEELASSSLAQTFANIKNDVATFKDNLGQAFAGPVKKIADKIEEITKALSSEDLTNFADDIEKVFNRIWKKIEPIFDFIKLAIKYPEMLSEIKETLVAGGKDLVDGIKDYAKWSLIWLGAFTFKVLQEAATLAFGKIKDPDFWKGIDGTIGTALNNIGAALNITGFKYSSQALTKNADGSYSLPEGTSFAGYANIKVKKNDDGTVSIYDSQGKELGNFTVDAEGYAHLVFDALNIDYTNFDTDAEGRYKISTPIYGYSEGILFDADNLKAYDMNGKPIEDLSLKIDGNTVTITPKNGTMFKLVLGETSGSISPEDKISIQDAVDKYWNAIKSVIEDSWNEKAVISLMPNLKMANPELSEQEILDKYMIDLIGNDASPWYKNLMSLLSGLWDGVVKPDILDPAWDWFKTNVAPKLLELAKIIGETLFTAFNNLAIESDLIKTILSAVGLPIVTRQDVEKTYKEIEPFTAFGLGLPNGANSLNTGFLNSKYMGTDSRFKKFSGTWYDYFAMLQTLYGDITQDTLDMLSRIQRAKGVVTERRDYISFKQIEERLENAVPHYAKGGLVTKPTLALIGEAGPELVIPNKEIPKLADGDSPDHGIFRVNFKGASDYADEVASGFVNLTEATETVSKTTKKIDEIIDYYKQKESSEEDEAKDTAKEEISAFQKWINNSKYGKIFILAGTVLHSVSESVDKILDNITEYWSKENKENRTWYTDVEKIFSYLDLLPKAVISTGSKGLGFLVQNGAFGTHLGNIVNGSFDDDGSFSILKMFSAIIQELIPYLEKGLSVIGGLFDEAFEILINTVRILGERLGKNLLPILEAFIPLMKIVSDILIALTPVVESVLKPAIMIITAILQALVPILDMLMPIFAGIGAVIQWVAESITYVISSVINWLAGWLPIKGVGEPKKPGSIASNYNTIMDAYNAARATPAATITADSASTASQTASYNGASVIHIHNSFDGSYIVGSNGMRELALIIKNVLEDVEYSGQSV